jgi:hypothetical protein
MAVDQQAVRTAIGVAQSAVRGEDSAAAETVRLSRLSGPDCVTFLHHLVCDDRALLSQRVRASCVLLETAGLIGGASSESKSSAAFREPTEGDGASGRDAA